MFIADVLTEATKLPRHEKLRLVRTLLEELTMDELSEKFHDCQVFILNTPTYSPSAAGELARVLAQDGETK